MILLASITPVATVAYGADAVAESTTGDGARHWQGGIRAPLTLKLATCGAQMMSRATGPAIAKALQAGCRVVELDCWESWGSCVGGAPQILVTHGFAMVSAIDFQVGRRNAPASPHGHTRTEPLSRPGARLYRDVMIRSHTCSASQDPRRRTSAAPRET